MLGWLLHRPPTHPLIRHNAVLFLVTIKGPPGESRKLFIFCYITSLAFEDWSVLTDFCDASRLSSSSSWLAPISQHLTGLFPRAALCLNSSRISWRSLVWKSRYRGREGWTPVWPVPRARQSAAEFQKPCSCVGRFSRLHGIRKKQKDGKCLHPPEKNCLFPMPLFCGVADWGEETSEAKMPCRVYLYQR